MAKNTKIVKRANSFLVLDAIRRSGPVTIEDLVKTTELSRPTVLSILKKLQRDFIVQTSGFAATDIGRQPVLYVINSSGFYAIGIDVDVPPINMVVTGLDGKIVYSITWEIGYNDEATIIAQSILDHIQEAMNVLGIQHQQVMGVALGMPASIDMESNMTVRLSRLSKWNNYPISEVIEKKLGVKTYLRNDAHLISVAEHQFLAGVENSLFIVHRSGVGMSAMINHQIYEGAMGNSGYIGHTTIDINGRSCDCGQKGCFETYCSKRAISKDYFEISGKKATYKEILDLASSGDEIARKVLEIAGGYFGIGVSNFIRIFEIYTVVIGDIICNEDHIFFRSIVDSTVRSLNNYTNEKPQILKGRLTSDNFGLGGCYFLLEKFFTRPKLKFGDPIRS